MKQFSVSYTQCAMYYTVYYVHSVKSIIHNVSQCSIIPSEITLPLPPAACSNQTSSGCFEHSKPLVVSFNSNTFRLSRSETKSGQCLIILHNLRGISFLPPPNFAIKHIELHISVVALSKIIHVKLFYTESYKIFRFSCFVQ